MSTGKLAFTWPQRTAKTLSLFIVVYGLSFVASGCTSTNSTSSTTTVSNETKQTNAIRLGFQKGSIIPIAHQRGELERQLTAQNIKVEWVGPFDRCATLLQAVTGGKADIGGCGDIPSISGIAAKQPLCIGAVQPPDPKSLSNAILVRGDSAIHTPNELVGKKVAVNQGGTGEYLLLKVLEKNHIPKDKVNLVYLGPTDALPALLQGSVDAWAVWDPYISIAELEHGARRITTTHPAPTYEILLAHSDTAAQNRVGLQAALTALSKEAQWLNQHPSEYAGFMIKALKVSPAVAKRAAENRGIVPVILPKPDDVAHLQKTADWMLEHKLISTKVDIAAAVCPTQQPSS